MVSSGLVFDWTIHPNQLVGRLVVYEAAVFSAIRALFDVMAARIESYARANAPWNDITGAARQGLRSFVEGGGLEITLYLVTSVAYGLFLELGTRYMAPLPIVVPALQAHYAIIVSAITALLGG